MAVHYRTQGIILKKIDRGEANRLFTFYTKDFGKLEILGKAIRKISSKLKAGAELLYLSEIEFIQGKFYKTLTDATLIQNFDSLRKDLRKLKVAFQVVEVLDQLVVDQEKDEKIWQLLIETFQRLNDLQFSNSDLPTVLTQHYYYFVWNLLAILGHKPEFFSCCGCQKELAPPFYFSPEQGGLICSNCLKNAVSEQHSKRFYAKIEPEIIKILRIILKKDWGTLSRLKIEKYQKNLQVISRNYLFYILESSK